MTYRHVDLLRVEAFGRSVGAVGPSSTRRGYAFQYDPAWVHSGIELSPLLMPLAQARSPFTFPGLNRETFHDLPPMIADSLPDAFGNGIVDAVLAREGVAPDQIAPVDRLAYVGARGMGALTFTPDHSPHDLPTSLEMNELVEAARRAVQGDLGTPGTRTDALNHLLAVGTSAGGARAKAVIAWNRTTGEMTAGGLQTPHGYEQWLLKFDGVGTDHQLGKGAEYGRTEYAYSLMAREAGIDMAPTELLEEGGRAHFVTRRFDRPGTDGERLHMQTLCGIGALDFNAVGVNDYASYFTTMASLGIDDREEAFRRVVFNVLASNNDDHTKNLSFLMEADGTWRLAPAYDVTFAYNPTSQWVSRHLMSVEGKFEHITAADLEVFGDRAGVAGYRDIIARVADAVARFDSFADAASLSQARRLEIEERLALVRAEALA
ncbi:type II toxin-antitoxin system HipA family toxin [Demequina lutea]|uniref:Serine/threonine-protein kinase HipA n=1 Tax=Demequina lutea TaxID=431489 RepID=A0A7Y9Z7D1_9MICO|nr:type II toxin-antitoxin system HipA family toxin [Demequina lutea]NYI39966.1 serine/threonine-protein kinase HipA [Demequina lutea]